MVILPVARDFTVGVYEREGKSVISVCKKATQGEQMHFLAVKKVVKTLWVCDLFIFSR